MTEKPLYEQFSMIQLFHKHASVIPGASLEEFTRAANEALLMQRGVMWWIGDIALGVEAEARKDRSKRHWPEQIWDPELVSPDLIARAKAVAAAYPPENRNPDATWTVHMQLMKRGDRVAAVQATVDAGQTSDQARRDPPPPVAVSKADPPAEETGSGGVKVETVPVLIDNPQSGKAQASDNAPAAGWLLAVDVNYYLMRLYTSGSGLEAGINLMNWLIRLVERLQTMGLTDFVLGLDSPNNHRKALTAGWEKPYKDRSDKPVEFLELLKNLPSQAEKHNIPWVMIDGFESDDILASYAVKFPGKVTLLSQDKDMRQCLSGKCNILEDATWDLHPETGKPVVTYKWVTARSHVEDGLKYASGHVSGITPELWPHFQAIAGDAVDTIKGAKGIGTVTAMELVKNHGTIADIFEAIRERETELTDKQILAMMDFEEFAETTLKLTTLRTDLDVPLTTRIALHKD